MSRRKVTTANAVAAIAVLLAVAGLFAIASGIAPLLTTDQRGYRLYADAAYTEAANRFSDPLWAGIALYRAREFEQAAGVFAGIDTAIAAFNRGNSFVFLGRYEEAAASYSRALELDPDFEDARVNLEIALGRAELLRLEGGEMTGGRIGADDFVFGEGDPSTNAGEDQTETIEAPTAAEQRALWLRQVTTEPADFLAAKFAYQAAMQDATAGNAQ